jgi:serine/threonine-protein kinase HipA
MISRAGAGASALPAPLWVWMYLPGSTRPVLCGRFDLDPGAAGKPVGSFVYGKSYLARDDALPVDPVALPLEARTFRTTALNGWFSALLDAGPDAWGKRIIEKVLGTQDQRGYLLHARGQTVGALAFTDDRDTPPASPLSTTPATLAVTLKLHARVEAGEQLTAEESRQLLGEAGSGGARPKLTLEDDGRLWLVKGISINDSAEQAPVPCVEAALLTLAGACGISVPAHQVRHIGGQPAVLVERFDRMRTGAGFSRWRYASAQTIFWSRPDVAIYSFQGSYTNLARQLRVWERSPAHSVRELYRRVVFNALVGNTDDHEKNHGVVAGPDGGFSLAPAFDLTVCAKPGANNFLQMAFGTGGARIALANLLSECEVFGYAKAEAHELVRHQWALIDARLMARIVANGASEETAERTCALMPGRLLLR